jgi:hypothetical protein
MGTTQAYAAQAYAAQDSAVETYAAQDDHAAQDDRSEDHLKHAEECVAMAQAADDDKDKVLWLTLAQSWVRLAEHVARVATAGHDAISGEDSLAVQAHD